eukprot:scaffold672_cov126-Cylindrotheca_fusiformis.AAC.24
MNCAMCIYSDSPIKEENNNHRLKEKTEWLEGPPSTAHVPETNMVAMSHTAKLTVMTCAKS